MFDAWYCTHNRVFRALASFESVPPVLSSLLLAVGYEWYVPAWYNRHVILEQIMICTACTEFDSHCSEFQSQNLKLLFRMD